MKRYRGKRNKRCFIWAGAAILWMLFIWSNSLEPAVQSSETSAWWVELLDPILHWIPLDYEAKHVLVRKLAHMTEFAVLTILWSGAFYQPERGMGGPVAAALVGSLLAACADEFIQLFVPSRSGSVIDVLIDMAGALLAAAILLLVSHFREKQRS